MKSSPQAKSGETASHIFMILVTLVQLVFFTAYHEYIAWPITKADGSVTRLSMLTDAYFTWLPIPVVASILAILVHIIFIFYDNDRFRVPAEIILYISGITVTVSLVSIFPFDFSVIPNATVANVVPTVVTAFFIFMAIFYGTVTVFWLVKLKKIYSQARD